MKDEFERLLDEGFEKFYVGKWDDAEKLYDAARKLRPNSGIPVVLQGRSLLMQGRLPKAREKFLEALQIEPDCVQAYEAISSLFGLFGANHFDALRCLLYALQIKPDRRHTWVLLLSSLGQLNVPDVLNSVTQMALSYATGDTEGDYDLRCAVYKALQHRIDLVREAEQFIEKFPSSRSAEMYRVMSAWGNEADDSACEGKDEDDFDGGGWKEIVEQYAESFRVDEDTRKDIAHLWDSYLNREVTLPDF